MGRASKPCVLLAHLCTPILYSYVLMYKSLLHHSPLLVLMKTIWHMREITMLILLLLKAIFFFSRRISTFNMRVTESLNSFGKCENFATANTTTIFILIWQPNY